MRDRLSGDQIVQVAASMLHYRLTSSNFIDVIQIDFSDFDTSAIIAYFSEDFAPGVDDHSMAIGFALFVVGANLGGGYDVALGFDGARAKEHLNYEGVLTYY